MRRLAVVGLLAIATACSSEATPPSRPGSDLKVLGAILQTNVGSGQVSNVVKVLNGYEAASWTSPVALHRHHRSRYDAHHDSGTGEITFWRLGGREGGWQPIGRSRYVTVDIWCAPARITAGVVRGASDALYVADLCLTGDGVFNAAAFANGPKGWGVVEAVVGGRLVSQGRAPRQPFAAPWLSARHFEMAFVDDELQVKDGTAFFANAGSDLFPRISRWVWSRDGLVRTSDSVFVAEPQAAPYFEAPAMPSARCPTSGVYSASFALHPLSNEWRESNDPVTIGVFPPSGQFPHAIKCWSTIAALTPMTVETAYLGTRLRYPRYAAHLSNKQWMSAPVWLLLQRELGGMFGHHIPVSGEAEREDRSPYVIPDVYGVNDIVMDLGDLVPGRHFERRLGRPATPTPGTVTFRDGKVVGLAVRP